MFGEMDDHLAMYFGVVLMTTSFLLLKKRRRWYSKRWWFRPINREREIKGAYPNIFKAMQTMDKEEFFSYTRMDRNEFLKLEELVTPYLIKRRKRKALSVGHRLAMTLKYLAHGGSTKSLGWEYYIAESTAQKVLKETCTAIYRALSPIYLKKTQWRRLDCHSQPFSE